MQEHETYIGELDVDMSQIAIKMPFNNAALVSGTIVNVEVAFSGLDQHLLGLDLYEVKDGSVVNNQSSLLSSSKNFVSSDSLVVHSYGLGVGPSNAGSSSGFIFEGMLDTRFLRFSVTWLAGWNRLICSVDGKLTGSLPVKLEYLMRITAAASRSKMSRHCTAASHLPERPDNTMLQYMAAVCTSSRLILCLTCSQLKMVYKNDEPAMNRLCVAAHV
ncbi:hypothetical protein OGAPHI_003075 [Ogataea philodendri]|uniref:Uncharacterized protein n=1 Tax=Ogataea philodendri TaxID=1378263 RepID=A0A9P8T646_9ASCO|nr:uncharacterized protein OGAPHI_003075 [Ogataea philodendri]KAH3667426.1 hypothetical protein OGAPHI_003075 [Ogataea philodendri]